MRLLFNKPVSEGNKAFIEKRNSSLLNFFTAYNLDVTLSGDAENPMIVLCHGISLAAYVRDFDLLFLNRSFQGEVIGKVALDIIQEVPRHEILLLLKAAVHVGIFRIQETKSEYYLAGYNFRDPENRRGRYPVFARETSIFYKAFDRAEEMKNVLLEDGYDVEIVKPDMERLTKHLGFKPSVEYNDTRPQKTANAVADRFNSHAYEQQRTPRKRKRVTYERVIR